MNKKRASDTLPKKNIKQPKNKNMKENQTNQSSVVIFDEVNHDLIKSNELPLTPVDLNNGELPDLDDAEVLPLDLMSDYWTPKLPGETKRVYFDSIKMSAVQDMNDKEVMLELPCAYFFEKLKGEVKTIRNGSKRLIAVLENNRIERGTPLQIEYLGKKKNQTNSYMSDDWSIKPLMIKS